MLIYKDFICKTKNTQLQFQFFVFAFQQALPHFCSVKEHEHLKTPKRQIMTSRKFYRFCTLFMGCLFFAAIGYAQPTGPSNVCQGSVATYSFPISPCDTAWQWSIDPPLGNILNGQGTPTVTIEWFSVGMATLQIIASDSCTGSVNEVHFPIFIEPTPFTILTYAICPGECVSEAGQQFCDPGQYSVTLTSMMGCDSIVNIFISFIPQLTTDLGTFCQSEITVCNETFTGPGSYQATCISVQGCDSIVVFTLADPGSLVADAGPPIILDCITTTVTLDGSGSTQGPGITYTWTGPNGFLSSQLNPAVSFPGTFCLTVVDQNGCQAMDCVDVLEDVVLPSVIVQGDTTASCDGSPIMIVAAVAPGGPGYSYQWTTQNGNIVNGSTTLNPLVDSPGIYCLIVTDLATGCTGQDCVTVTDPVTVTVSGPTIVCDTAEYIYVASLFSGSPPLNFYVSANGGAPEIHTGLQIGAYTFFQNINQTTDLQFWATDAGGCTSDTFDLTTNLFSGEIDFQITENGCNPTVVTAVPNFPVNPGWLYSWEWSNGVNGPQLSTTSSGMYYVTVTASGQGLLCDLVDSVYVEVDFSGSCAYIEGQVLEDLAENCIIDTDDQSLINWLIVAEGNETFYGTTDADGHYFIPVSPGDYSVTVVPANPFWEPCSNDVAVSLPNADDEAVVDFLVKKLPGCPQMTVDISTSVLRRCFTTNFYHIDYCNIGVETAMDAYVEVTFDDFLTLINSSMPAEDLGNNVFRFDVGDVEPGECGSFWAQVYVSCDAVLGETHCTEAHVFPDSTCTAPNPNWSGASLEVTSECADSVYFTITNTGNAPMSVPLEYVVIEDAVMYMQAANGPALGVGQSVTIAFPANGATWNILVEQEPFHPASLSPVLALEGCGTNPSGTFSLGIVNQFSLGDDPDFLDIDCTENIGSYDPNDKQAMPVGYGVEHFIEPETEIEYMIRFQNTGTDTAFNVSIRDTLSSIFDITTLRPGASSHPYQYEIYGQGILKLLFPGIMLPDSSENWPGSQGFVQFKVRPRSDVPLGTKVHNTASIYFDFNEPVRTNTVFHTIDEGFVVVQNVEALRPDLSISVSPNPFHEVAEVRIAGLEPAENLSFSMLDFSGKVVLAKQFDTPGFQLKATDIPPGFYILTIELNGEVVGTGKLVRH